MLDRYCMTLYNGGNNVKVVRIMCQPHTGYVEGDVPLYKVKRATINMTIFFFGYWSLGRNIAKGSLFTLLFSLDQQSLRSSFVDLTTELPFRCYLRHSYQISFFATSSCVMSTLGVLRTRIAHQIPSPGNGYLQLAQSSAQGSIILTSLELKECLSKLHTTWWLVLQILSVHHCLLWKCQTSWY